MSPRYRVEISEGNSQGFENFVAGLQGNILKKTPTEQEKVEARRARLESNQFLPEWQRQVAATKALLAKFTTSIEEDQPRAERINSRLAQILKNLDGVILGVNIKDDINYNSLRNLIAEHFTPLLTEDHIPENISAHTRKFPTTTEQIVFRNNRRYFLSKAVFMPRDVALFIERFGFDGEEVAKRPELIAMENNLAAGSVLQMCGQMALNLISQPRVSQFVKKI